MCFNSRIEWDTVEGICIGQKWSGSRGMNSDHINFKKYCSKNIEKITNDTIFMYPFIMHINDLRKIIPRFKELSYKIRIETGAWESDMWALIIATVENDIDIITRSIGCCNNWDEYRNNDYPIIHYPAKIFDKYNNKIWWKQDYTTDTLQIPWKRPSLPNETTNKIK